MAGGGGGLPASNAGAATAAASLANPSQPAPLQLAPVPAEMLAPLEERLTAVEAAINRTSLRFSRERLIYAVVISFLVGLTAVTAIQALLNSPKPAATTGTTATTTGVVQKPAALNGTTPAGGEAARAGASVPVNKEGVSAPSAAVPANTTSQASGATKNAVRASALQALSQRQAQAARDARKTAGSAAAPAVPGGYVVRVLMEVKEGQVTEARVLNPRPGAGDYESLALRMARQRRYPKTFTGGDTWNIRVKP